jgi:hypothetical protein
MNKNIFFLLTLVMVIFNMTCKKSETNKRIKIEGFQLFDNLGNSFGRIGPADNDWQFINWSTLSSFEQALLSSTDTVNMNNTAVSSVSFNAYPNPVNFVSSIGLASADSVKFKLVIVDESGAVLKHIVKKIKGPSSFLMDVSDRNLFQAAKSIRYYYSFSSTNNLHFKIGYGDIKICDYPYFLEPSFQNLHLLEQTCF